MDREIHAMHSSSRLTPEGSPIWLQNVSWYETMGKTNRPTSELDLLDESTSEVKPKTIFAQSLVRRTALQGMVPSSFLKRINEIIPMTEARMKLLRSK